MSHEDTSGRFWRRVDGAFNLVFRGDWWELLLQTGIIGPRNGVSNIRSKKYSHVPINLNSIPSLRPTTVHLILIGLAESKSLLLLF